LAHHLTRADTSACFAAGFRLAATVSYSLSKDVTYTFCTVGIWVVVELTCSLIVLCTPSILMALKELGVTKGYNTVKAWATASWKKTCNMQNTKTFTLRQPYRQTAVGHQRQVFHSSSAAEFEKKWGLADPKSISTGPGGRPTPENAIVLQTAQVAVTTQTSEEYSLYANEPWSQRPWDIEAEAGQRMRTQLSLG
jgi:hypothetical protein